MLRARQVIEQIRSGDTGEGEEAVPSLTSAISPAEGDLLQRVIEGNPGISSVLEVGLAYGISALYMADALEGRVVTRYVAVDPHQDTQWRSLGVKHLARAGIDYVELITDGSEVALPRLLADGARFDLIFIDGWHTFDHTLLDLFYANRLTPVGGHIVVDDCSWPSVGRAIAYFANYPCYEVVDRCGTPGRKERLAATVRAAVPERVARWVLPHSIYARCYTRTPSASMVALRKVAEDDRDWRWFEEF